MYVYVVVYSNLTNPISTKHKIQLRLMGIWSYQTDWNFDLMMRLDKKLSHRQSSHWIQEDMNVQTKFTEIHPVVVETCQSKPQMWISLWRYRKSHRITKVIGVHLLGTINICTKCHGSPSDTCEISVWTKVVEGQTVRYCHPETRWTSCEAGTWMNFWHSSSLWFH